MSPGAQCVSLAGTTIRIGLEPSALQGRVVRDSWLAAEGLHPGPPFRAVRAHAARPERSVNERVRYLVDNGIREVCIPVLTECLRIKSKLLMPVAQPPLAGGFSRQVKKNLGCRSRLAGAGLYVKVTHLFLDGRFLFFRQFSSVVLQFTSVFIIFSRAICPVQGEPRVGIRSGQ